jgi:hypothetical protein
MRKPQVTMGFSTKSWSNNLDDLGGTPMTLETSISNTLSLMLESNTCLRDFNHRT